MSNKNIMPSERELLLKEYEEAVSLLRINKKKKE